MIPRQAPIFIAILSLLVFIEVFAFTDLGKDKSFYYASSILFFAAETGICLLPLWRRKHSEQTGTTSDETKTQWYVTAIILLFGMFTTIYFLNNFIRLIHRTPIDFWIADMLPHIQSACERLLAGKKIYTVAPEIWDGCCVLPYLPAMWFPFLPGVMLGFDIRWIPVALFLPVFWWLIGELRRFNSARFFMIAAPLFLSLFWLIDASLFKIIGFWIWTEEGLVAAYFLFLGLTLMYRNPYWIAFAISLCILSRYSLLFWVPLYFVWQWMDGQKEKALKSAMGVFTIVLVTFIIPFFIWQPMYFINIPALYRLHVHDFWTITLQIKTILVVGLWKFFTYEQINLLRTLQVAGCVLGPILCFYLYHQRGIKTNTRRNLTALCSLKLSLVFFYNLLEYPFDYLFVIPVILSFPILLLSFSEFNHPKTNDKEYGLS